jgi:uncharacterized protein YidB (DUF937 family)
MAYATWSTASNRPVTARRLIPGLATNKQIGPSDLEKAIGPDVLATLLQHTGLSREEILARLSKNLPEAVDKYTPDGRIPSAAELA